MSQLERLGADVSSSLEDARIASNAASRVRAKLIAREPLRPRETPRLRIAGIAGVLAFAATIVFALAFAWPRSSKETLVTKDTSATLSFVIGAGNGEEAGKSGAFIAAPASAETPLTFSDGSKLRVAPAARVRVSEVSQHGARVLVESGALHVAVVHRDEETRWAVEAGPFEIRVTGTEFDVAWDPAATSLVVRMLEGSVYVRGCGLLGDEGRRLAAGEHLAVSCRDRALVVAPVDALTAKEPPSTTSLAPTSLPPSPSSPVATSLAPSPTTAPPSSSALPVVEASRVVELARRGAHAEALAAAEARGFGATCEALDGAELLLLADAARYVARFDRAAVALETARRRFAGTDAAATAAFELGRIGMDVRHDLSAAGDHFETYLRERPSGSLAREALGRALEARHRAGDDARAERLGVQYLAAYPDGPHAKLARKLTAPEDSAP